LYKKYTAFVPIAFGLLNILGLFVTQKYDLTKIERFILTGVIGGIFMAILLRYFKLFDYPDKSSSDKHKIVLFLVYIYIYCLVVFMLEDLLIGV